MRQVVREGLSAVSVVEVPAPPVPTHGVRVAPAVSLISSGTETASIHPNVLKEVADNPGHLKKVLGVMRVQGPLQTIEEVRAKFSELATIGYTGAGYVDAVGAGVRDLEPGTRVAYGGEGTGHADFIVTGRNLVARIPAPVSFSEASFATIGSIALNAVRQAEIGIGDTVAVVGLGLVGQLACQLARVQGARVIGIDLLDDRCQLALALGAEAAIRPSETTKAQVLALTGGIGADRTIICAASKGSGPCELGLAITRDRGALIIVGAVQVQVPWAEAYIKEVRILMARAYGPGSYDPEYEQRGVDYPLAYVRWTENRNMSAFMELVARGQVKTEPLVTDRFPIADAAAAYQRIMDPTKPTLAVTLDYGRPDAPIAKGTEGPARTIRLPSPEGPRGALGLGLVGVAGILRWAHMPAVKAIGGTSIRSVYSSNGVRARSCANRYGAANCTTDLESVVTDPSVDAVLITSRNQLHAPQALAALRHGKHVFVEKPMALTRQECAELVAAESQGDRILWVGFNRRFAPDYLAIHRALAQRRSPAIINCRVNSPGIAHGYWMADPQIGGAILGEACHFVDLFCWLLSAEPVSVSAVCLPIQEQEPIGMNNMVAHFTFTDGSLASLTYSTMGHPQGGGEEVEAFATGVRLGTSDFRAVRSPGLLGSRRRLLPSKGYLPQMRAFLAAVRGEGGATVGAAAGARATIGCLAMLESARHAGTPVAIDVPV